MEQNTDRINELRTMPYEDYLQTPEWQDRRASALARAGERCQVCNADRELQVHHRTYERRGNEDPGDLTVLCRPCHARFHDRLSDTDDGHTFKPVATVLAEDMRKDMRTDQEGVTTGFSGLDRVLGKLQPTNLILLGGRTRHGKTALALNIAYNAAKAGHPVAFFSLEMTSQQLVQRILAAQCRIDLLRLRQERFNCDGEISCYLETAQALSELPMWLSDTTASLQSIRQQLQSLVQEVGEIGLVVIDYLGLITPDKITERLNAEQQVRAISRGLKLLAREFNVPVLVLCQLSRAAENRPDKTPQLIDLRDSGAQEQDADVVLLIHNHGIADPEGELSPLVGVIVAKQRNGPVGVIPLHFTAQYNLFQELEFTPPPSDLDE